MKAVEQLASINIDTYTFPTPGKAVRFARLVRENEALDIVKVKRVGGDVTVEYIDSDFDRGCILGLSFGCGATE